MFARISLTAIAVMLLASSVALAQEVDLPSTGGAAPAPGAAPSPAAAPAPRAALPTRKRKAVLKSLRLGARGAVVRDLQRELRRRGARIRVDGVFGRATRRAVVRLKRRMRMRPSGVATVAFLRRLGIRARLVAGAAAPAAGAYLKVFPVRGDYRYDDDFGAPRGQGPHQGTDIIAPRGAPILAVASGTIERLSRIETGLGGIWIWQRDRAGNTYYYAHLQTIADGLDAGSRVTAGQIIGTNGNTGDARYGVTHLHFEIHRDDRAAINPYPHLLSIDPKRRLPNLRR